MALGARPRALVRQLVVEGLCLGIASGLLGLIVAIAGKRALLSKLDWLFPELGNIDLSWQVLLFDFGLSALAGVIFALLPAFAVVRAEMHDLLRRASSANTLDLRGRRLRHGFAIAESPARSSCWPAPDFWCAACTTCAMSRWASILRIGSRY